jgi:thiol-disulfide isomerase/thioredoxin
MKKFIKISIPVFLFLGIGFMLFKSFKKIEHKKQIEQHIQKIPQLDFKDIQTGLQFANQNLKRNTSILVIYFNTECEHCQYEISEISKNIEQFNHAQIVLVSIEEPDFLLSYFAKSNLLNLVNVFILYDNELRFEKIFGNCPFPTTFIYDKNWELVKQFKGEVKIEALLKYLKV